jgi:hypothetical protein
MAGQYREAVSPPWRYTWTSVLSNKAYFYLIKSHITNTNASHSCSANSLASDISGRHIIYTQNNHVPKPTHCISQIVPGYLIMWHTQRKRDCVNLGQRRCRPLWQSSFHRKKYYGNIVYVGNIISNKAYIRIVLLLFVYTIIIYRIHEN